MVENKRARDVNSDIESGMFDKEINAQKTETSQEKLNNLKAYFTEVVKNQEAAKAAEEAAKVAEEAAKLAAATPAAGATPTSSADAAKVAEAGKAAVGEAAKAGVAAKAAAAPVAKGKEAKKK